MIDLTNISYAPEDAWCSYTFSFSKEGEDYLKKRGIKLDKTPAGKYYGEDIFEIVRSDPGLMSYIKEMTTEYCYQENDPDEPPVYAYEQIATEFSANKKTEGKAASSPRLISQATIDKCAQKGEQFLKHMKKRKEQNPSKWDDLFDGYLDPESMQPLPGVGYKEKMRIISMMSRFLGQKICAELWGSQSLVFFAVLWAKEKTPEAITRERDILNATKGNQKKRGQNKKKL